MNYDAWKTACPPEGHDDCETCEGTGLHAAGARDGEDGIDCAECDGDGIARKCGCAECNERRHEDEERRVEEMMDAAERRGEL